MKTSLVKVGAGEEWSKLHKNLEELRAPHFNRERVLRTRLLKRNGEQSAFIMAPPFSLPRLFHNNLMFTLKLEIITLYRLYDFYVIIFAKIYSIVVTY